MKANGTERTFLSPTPTWPRTDGAVCEHDAHRGGEWLRDGEGPTGAMCVPMAAPADSTAATSQCNISSEVNWNLWIIV